MKYKPGSLDASISLIDSLPDGEFKQNVIKEFGDEINRLKRKEYTEDELKFINAARRVGRSSRDMVEKMALDCFLGDK